jgi:hypothetical protein
MKMSNVVMSYTFEAVFGLLSQLHHKKTLVYKDSWKKHGELLGVFSNITRKYDRIETVFVGEIASTADESLLDTVSDLAVYAAKYLTYLAEHYPDIFLSFIASYNDAEPLEHYIYNEGFGAVGRILSQRYHSSFCSTELQTYQDCFAAMTLHYKALEDMLINGDWRSHDPRKCTHAADLSLSAFQYLVLSADQEPVLFQRLVTYIQTL